ncbi:MAG: DUF2092 domain-containing protein [Rhodospirillales bacterium]
MTIPALSVAAIVLVAALAGGLPSRAAEPPPAAGAGTMDEAMAILDRMASFLADRDHFSVDLRSGYDAVQGSGQKIEFLERRSIVVSRPDRLRIRVDQSDGEQITLLFDGSDITAFLERENVYAQVRHPGSVDDAVDFVVDRLKTRVPLALLLTTRFATELAKRVEQAAYVERSLVTPVPAHHIAARTEDVDFQLWIAADGDPLPYRVVITYRTVAGEPRFWADFSDWDLSPDVSPELFAFSPPTGAEPIPVLVRIREPGVVQ